MGGNNTRSNGTGRSHHSTSPVTDPPRKIVSPDVAAMVSEDELKILNELEAKMIRGEDEFSDIADYLDEDPFLENELDILDKKTPGGDSEPWDVANYLDDDPFAEDPLETLLTEKLQILGITKVDATELMEKYPHDLLLWITQTPDPHPGYTPSNLLFGTSEDGEKIGSIYFKTGRIRLCHKMRPTISTLDDRKVEHYILNKQQADVYFRLDSGIRAHIRGDLYECIEEQEKLYKDDALSEGGQARLKELEREEEKLREDLHRTAHVAYLTLTRNFGITLLKDATNVGPGTQLLEVFLSGNGEADGFHISRGFPTQLPVTLKQYDIDYLCQLASIKSNSTLKYFMSIHPLLSQIKMY